MAAGRLRHLRLALLIGAAGAAFAATGLGFALEEDIGLRWLFRLRGERAPPPQVAVLGIDRASLARLRGLEGDVESWPGPLRACERRWGGLAGLPTPASLDTLPRALFACLVRELDRRGADVVVFDVAFPAASDREAGVWQLAEAMRAHGGVVLLQRAVRAWLAQEDAARAPRADILELPHPALARQAAGLAPFLLPKAATRVNQFWVRSPALSEPVQLPLRALEVRAARAEHRRADGLPARPGDDEARAALARLQAGRPYYYLNFYGPAGTIPSASVADLLAPGIGHRAPDLFRDLRGKTVFVGHQELAVPDGRDVFPTVFRSPRGVDLSGVEIAATAFANLLQDQAIRSLPEGLRILVVLLAGTALALASLLGTAWRGLAMTLAVAVTYLGGVVTAFALFHLWLPLFVPIAVLLPVAIGAGQVARYLGAARWLGVYIPRQVSRHLLKGEERFAALPQRREVTVMLTDIVGFTRLAERSTPEEVTAFVNRHFTMLAERIEAEGGVLAQFIGDSVMAFWGAPDPQPDHAARACRAAVAIARALEAENRERVAAGLPPVRLRVGINTGEVTAGNVGAPGRSNYGIVGDTVNSTQRIEQLGKALCPDGPTAAVLVSGRTREKAGDAFAFEDVGEHLLRGRERPERLYCLRTEAAPAEGAARVAVASSGR